MALLYPPTSFSFIVNGISTTEGIDSRFQSISGLSTEITTEEYAEGGETGLPINFLCDQNIQI